MTTAGLWSVRITGNSDLHGNRETQTFLSDQTMSGYSDNFNRDLLRLQAELDQEKELK